ncbi:MAG: hypothetical protein ACFFEW_14585, partial [Candidatus Thorarchaeota archaeon]
KIPKIPILSTIVATWFNDNSPAKFQKPAQGMSPIRHAGIASDGGIAESSQTAAIMQPIV